MIVAIVQARMGSTRLPGKSLAAIAGKPMLTHVLALLSQSKKVEKIIVATTAEPSDDPIASLCKSGNIDCFRGSTEDVLSRYAEAVEKFGGDTIVRVTADCPLLDPQIVDEVIADFEKGGADFVANVYPPTYPDGLDVEVFSRSLLMRAHKEAALQSEREHVTPYMHKNKPLFSQRNVEYNRDLSYMRWTVDEPEDLKFIQEIYRLLGKKGEDHSFRMKDVLSLIETHPKLASFNRRVSRNEGYQKSLEEDTRAK